MIKYEDVPQVVIQAFVAAEDARFFQHKGFDLQSISRAFFKNLAAGRIVQGAARSPSRSQNPCSCRRKEATSGKSGKPCWPTRSTITSPKEEILALYLNQIYLGHGTYGIEAASQGYFGKSARHLTLPEAALLAGLPKAPVFTLPFVYMERARQRQAYVTERMGEDGYITPQEKKAALAAPSRFAPFGRRRKSPLISSSMSAAIFRKSTEAFLYKEGLEVYTTLNLAMQKAARDAVAKGLRELDVREGYTSGRSQGALLYGGQNRRHSGHGRGA